MTEIFKGTGEKVTGIKQKTRDKLEAAQEGIKKRIEEYRRGATFDLGAFEMDLKKTGATQKGIEWARKQVTDTLPPGATILDANETPEGITLAKFKEDQLKAGAGKLANNPDEAKRIAGEMSTIFGGKVKGGILAGIIATLMAYVKGDKNPLKALFESITGKKSEEKKAEKKPEAKPETKTDKQDKPAKPEQAPEVASKDKEIVDEFKKHWPNLKDGSAKADIPKLKERYKVETDGKLDEAKTLTKIKDVISNNAASTSNLNKILTKIAEIEDGKNFKVRLIDLQLERYSSDDITKVLAVIKDDDNKYKHGKDLTKIRTFINAINKSDDLTKTIKEQEKTTTA